jgi:radical SAM superfamily enzyme YgiQ (UPF0313 family)
MAQVLFVQNLPYEYPGTGLIAALLKERGHRVDVAIASNFNLLKGRLRPRQILAFSIMSGMQRWAIAMAETAKSRADCFVVMGGPHPTYYPQILEENSSIDAICRGEGEYAMLDLADAWDKGADTSRIANLWVRSAGSIYKNEPRPLISDLDALPRQDRQVYYCDYPFLRASAHKNFIAGRGCPFDCSFCFNRELRELYRGKGDFVRMRSPQAVIEEIEEVRDNYGLKKVFFHDDTLILDSLWLREFLGLYRIRVGLPLYCSGRADTLTQEIARCLKAANCRVVSFAVESGNEELRKGLLNKNISNEKLIAASRILKENRIKLLAFNMVGIPAETLENAWETVRLNVRMGVNYPRCSFLTPYPGLAITDYARANGYLDCGLGEIDNFSQQSQSLIKNKEHDALVNMHHFFQTAVLFPWSIPLLRRLVKLPPNPLYRAWWGLVYFFVFALGEGRGIFRMMLFSVRLWVASLNGAAGHKNG